MESKPGGKPSQRAETLVDTAGFCYPAYLPNQPANQTAASRALVDTAVHFTDRFQVSKIHLKVSV